MQEDKPIISVIVPVFNVEKELSHCVESILTQSFQEFELILVDDGSKDQSGLICDQYALRNNHIKTVHKENGGVSSARNTGLDHVRGEYVTFIDSDDYVDSEWLKDLYSAITENSADMSIGNYKHVYDGIIKHLEPHEIGVYDIKEKSSKIDYAIFKVFGFQHGWEVCTRLFKTSIIQNQKLRFCETCNNFAEDMGFVLAYILYASKIVSISAEGYNYVQHAGSMMSKSNKVVKLNEMNEVSYYFSREYINKSGEDTTILPVMHFLIMYDQYKKVICKDGYSELSALISGIHRKEYWRSNTKSLFKCKKILEKYIDPFQVKRIMLFTRYCLHGNWKRHTIESALFYKIFTPRNER